MGPVAVVSGGRGAIGGAIARCLEADGFAVATWDRTPAGGVGALELECDLTVADDVDRAAAATRDALGAISVLVNAVGVAQAHELFVNMTARDWDGVVAANLRAPVNCMRAVLGGMRAERSGVIVNICSIWSTHADARFRSAYIASKWALLGATRAIATEAAADGIRVCAVSPGPVDTPMTETMAPAQVRQTWMTPSDVAAAVRYAVSDGAGAFHGGELQLFGQVRPNPES
jgi:NAD(P)-dependent dehydrogenase (short-subunit alcohol dehydrogenase family)